VTHSCLGNAALHHYANDNTMLLLVSAGEKYASFV